MAVHQTVAAVQSRLPWLYRRLIPLARVATRGWSGPVKPLRQRLGLPPGSNPVHAGQFSPWLNLAMFSRVLGEPQRDWPPNTVVTGAVSYDAVHGGLPDALTRFLDAGPPPVVFTLGSSAIAAASAPAFYQTSLEAAADLGARAVLLVGQHDGHRPVGVQPRTHSSPSGPHIPNCSPARRRSCTRAGRVRCTPRWPPVGRCSSCLTRTTRATTRCARRGSVSRGCCSRRNTRATAVRDHLRALLSIPAVTERAAAVAVRLRAEHGADRAAAAIEELAGRANPPARRSVPIP